MRKMMIIKMCWTVLYVEEEELIWLNIFIVECHDSYYNPVYLCARANVVALLVMSVIKIQRLARIAYACLINHFCQLKIDFQHFQHLLVKNLYYEVYNNRPPSKISQVKRTLRQKSTIVSFSKDHSTSYDWPSM
mmetsp:Transcript_5511/g.8101  ORF Transcript_5511/g.8101 Transcript_5511/m.8101 type:complete len:134 (-) Transcript_5511:43-444(-)